MTSAAEGDASKGSVSRNCSGIWLSRYEFHSSGRDRTFTEAHYVVLLQDSDRLTGQSLDGAASTPGSTLTLDLKIDRNVVTGTWIEQTASGGYYAGARYHGTVQLLIEPAGRRMAGKWAGFGKDSDINTGPWELIFQDASTNEDALRAYSRTP